MFRDSKLTSSRFLVLADGQLPLLIEMGYRTVTYLANGDFDSFDITNDGW